MQSFLINGKGFVGETQILSSMGYLPIRDLFTLQESQNDIRYLCYNHIKDKLEFVNPKIIKITKPEPIECLRIRNKKLDFTFLSDHPLWAKSKSISRNKIIRLNESSNEINLFGAGPSFFDKEIFFDVSKTFSFSGMKLFSSKYFESFSFWKYFIIGVLLKKGTLDGRIIKVSTKDTEKIYNISKILEKFDFFDYDIKTYSTGELSFSIQVVWDKQLQEYLTFKKRSCKDNKLIPNLFSLSQNEILGLYAGLTYSSSKQIKNRGFQTFYNVSPHLANIIFFTSALFGCESHSSGHEREKNSGHYKSLYIFFKKRNPLILKKECITKEINVNKRTGEIDYDLYCFDENYLFYIRGDSSSFSIFSVS